MAMSMEERLGQVQQHMLSKDGMVVLGVWQAQGQRLPISCGLQRQVLLRGKQVHLGRPHEVRPLVGWC